MSIVRTSHSKDNPYIMLDKRIVKSQTLSFEGKGYYAGLESDLIKWKDITEKIKKELLISGYVPQEEV